MNIGLCTIKRGLFVIRTCGKPPVTLCSSCGRSVCDEHLRPGQQCSECYATQNRHRSNDDDFDYYRTRHYYYDNYHYQPIYYGHHYTHHHESFDYREAQDSDWDGEGVAGSNVGSWDGTSGSNVGSWDGASGNDVGSWDGASGNDVGSWDENWDSSNTGWDES